MSTVTASALSAPDGTALAVTGPIGAGGPPVVALHGLSGTASSFVPILERVAIGRRAWALDFRGHGGSGHTPGGYGLEAYVSDADALLQALGESAVVVGHSLGSIVAMVLAQQGHPLVSAVVLEDPPAYVLDDEGFDRVFTPVFRVLDEHVRRLQAEDAPVSAYEALFGGAPHPAGGTNADRVHPDAITARAEAFAAIDPDAFTAMLDGRSRSGFDPDRPMRTPVLVLAADAECGAAFQPEHGGRLLASTPDARIVEVPGAGHNIRGDLAGRERYVELLAEFLARHG